MPNRSRIEGAAVRWSALGLLLAGFALRLVTLASQELRGDEAFSYLISRRPLAEVVPAVVDQGDPHSPLHYLLLHLWMRLAGDTELALRYPSVIAAVVALALGYRLGREMGGRTTGLILLAGTAFSQSLVWIAQDARSQYTLAMAASLGATLLLLRAVRHPRLGPWALYALACALTVYAHYYGAFCLLAHGLYLLASTAGRSRLRAWAAAGATSLILFAPWLVTSASRVVASGQLAAPDRPAPLPYLATITRELAVGQALARGAPALVVLAAALFVLGTATLLRGRRPWAGLFCGWLGLAAGGIFLVRLTRSTFNPFYILVAAPAWWTIIAAGTAHLLRGPVLARALAAISLGALLLGNLAGLARYYTDPDLSRTNGYRVVAAHLTARAEPGDAFVRHAPDPVFDYYLDRAGVALPRFMLPERAAATPEETARRLEALAGDHPRLWFVPYRDGSWDAHDVVVPWLQAHMIDESRLPALRLNLDAYRSPADVEARGQPLGRPLDNGIRLEGALLTHNGRVVTGDAGPLEARPGDDIAVILGWRAEAPAPESYTVFVHLLGEDGHLIAQHDGIPADGDLPTPAWSPGATVYDRHVLTVPEDAPPQQATLLVGMYHSQTVERVPYADGSDALPLAEIILR